MLITSATLMWITSRHSEEREVKAKGEGQSHASEKAGSHNPAKIYNWFLTSLVMIIIGAACTSQVFLLFIKLPGGLNSTDPEMSIILTAWTLGGMAASLACGWMADRIGRTKVIIFGLALSVLTPLLYSSASGFLAMALVYGVNGISFWTIQTVGFAFAGDMMPEDKRGRLFGRYNAVMALSWGPAGLLVGGPLADIQTRILGFSSYAAYVNTFYLSSIIVAAGTVLFVLKVARPKAKTD